ncbi:MULTISPECIES: saccharopine dehydrogenase NADP-binding domain-containing protein [unclassified Psychrobacter]|uniref:saccharopine dehydrogenase family protein n=1 Tax=unclassified Psychrobacter TaxID=196806 RepID=UPI0025B329C7|nr:MULTISPECIES: saccharopine dehydrogenase NADP-binding domain-containing protein [unclassified Psychrobacter]MDN3452147.1 saccharopine dehydrogenase NADP-binding domain-containing protein [Psychrobacter sp. APC 3350]MDN3502370.1 saccharopine dehydrogenase NADP-binding domain-containing protein [Psychrobacter sp. 5A.1]
MDTNTDIENPIQKNSEEKRPYAVVLYGATSFVGQITAHYLTNFLTNNKNKDGSTVTWAIAGRDEEKLNKLQSKLGSKVDIIIANSNDAASLDEMTKQTQVIISTVGPYLKYGEPLIKSCAENGTDYVDLTGEAIFIKDMMDKYQDTAKQSGARIVNSCGFDSIPSDLGVYFTQAKAEEQFGETCNVIHMRVKAAKGGISGGTIASMASIFEEAGEDKSRRKQVANPYLLNDDADAPNVRQDNVKKPEYDSNHKRWLAPFVMATINTRIVHRTNQLLSYEYGRDFKYDEAMWMKDGTKGKLSSYAMSAGLLGFATAMMIKPSRELLAKHVLPKAGSGPSKDEQENGYFDIRHFGQTAKNDTIIIKVTGDRDPGYGSTSRMISQAALCLAQDINKEDVGGGFWTPASAMGDKLITRLEAHSGLSFEVMDS